MVLLIFHPLRMAPLFLHCEGLLLLGIEFPTVSSFFQESQYWAAQLPGGSALSGIVAMCDIVLLPLRVRAPPTHTHPSLVFSHLTLMCLGVFLWVYLCWNPFDYLYL